MNIGGSSSYLSQSSVSHSSSAAQNTGKAENPAQSGITENSNAAASSSAQMQLQLAQLFKAPGQHVNTIV